MAKSENFHFGKIDSKRRHPEREYVYNNTYFSAHRSRWSRYNFALLMGYYSAVAKGFGNVVPFERSVRRIGLVSIKIC
jgi:hypothetical protein